MEFIDVTWRHEDQYEPIRLVSELDAQRYETRKLEFFLGGRVEFASSRAVSGSTMLGVEPVPSLAEINADPQFIGKAISKGEFEAMWVQYVQDT